MSGVITGLAIPLQLIDLTVGIIYPLKEAVFILVCSKMLGAAMTFYIANYFLSEESKKAYSEHKYL